MAAAAVLTAEVGSEAGRVQGPGTLHPGPIWKGSSSTQELTSPSGHALLPSLAHEQWMVPLEASSSPRKGWFLIDPQAPPALWVTPSPPGPANEGKRFSSAMSRVFRHVTGCSPPPTSNLQKLKGLPPGSPFLQTDVIVPKRACGTSACAPRLVPVGGLADPRLLGTDWSSGYLSTKSWDMSCCPGPGPGRLSRACQHHRL